MVIDSFAFGNIVIDGRCYASDLIIYPDGKIVDGWWRSSGHLLTENDIEELIAASPEIIVVGTGTSGMMRLASGLEQSLSKKGIGMVAAPCREALVCFNELSPSRKVGAGFHLTC